MIKEIKTRQKYSFQSMQIEIILEKSILHRRNDERNSNIIGNLLEINIKGNKKRNH